MGVAVQFEREEQVGLDDGVVPAALTAEQPKLPIGGADFLVGQLEQEGDGAPLLKMGAVLPEHPLGIESLHEGIRGVSRQHNTPLACVAQGFPEAERGLLQRLALKIR